MPHVLTLVEQFWHKVPGGTARATERTLAALIDRNEFTITGLAAAHRHRPPTTAADPRDRPWTDVPVGVDVRHHRLPRPLLYESWLRVGRPSIDGFAKPDSVFWASSLIVAPTTRPVVATVHDLDFLETPHLLTRRGRNFFPRMWEHARRRCQLFVCPSEAVAAQCRRHGVPAERVRVVPWGVDRPACPPDAVLSVLDRLLFERGLPSDTLERPFALLVAPDQPRKNPEGCARSLAAVDVNAVIVGSQPADSGVDSFAAAEGTDRRVVRTGPVSDQELSALYQSATVLLFPSLAEGFGLPVAEAMVHGLPVITSTGTATEEVAGDAALLVDPLDDNDIANALKLLVDDADLRADLAERGRRRSTRFTWDATAAGYEQLFREVL